MKPIRIILSYSILVIILAILSGCQGVFLSSGTDLQDEEIDTGCAYFYFLWGRQAELSYNFDEALEAYQKALICDPEADYIVRKIPILLLRLDRGEEAVTLLEEFLDENEDDTNTRMLLARVYIGLEKYDEAVREYRTIHQQDPKEVNSLLLLSELYLNREMLDEAEQVLREVLQVTPDSYPALVLLARIYFNTGRYDKAVEEYDAALGINWSADLLMEKADVYSRQQKTEKVIALYREILDKDKDNELAALALVNLLLQENKEIEALEELNRLKANSNLIEKVELSIARLYARMDEYEKAIDLLRSSLQKSESGDARYLLAILLTQTEQYDQALTEVKLVGKHHEEYESSLMLQVRILRFLDRQEDAIDLLEKSVKDEETRSPDMYVMLAAMYLLQNKTGMGQSTFDRAMMAFPDDNELLYEYGLFLDSSGKREEAMSVMEEVLKREPGHGEALNYVGYSWAEKSIHLDKALEYIQQAVKLKPESEYVRDSLGWVYYRLGRIEEAREALEYAVELAGDDPDSAIFDHLGDVYLELGRTNDALDAYRKGLDAFEEDEDSELKAILQEKLQLLEKQEE